MDKLSKKFLRYGSMVLLSFFVFVNNALAVKYNTLYSSIWFDIGFSAALMTLFLSVMRPKPLAVFFGLLSLLFCYLAGIN